MSFDYCKTADHVSYNHNMSSNTTTTSNSSDDETMNSSMDGLRRGPWMVEEDIALVNYIAVHGEGRWNSLARCAGLKRTGKSCRLRWLNYLRPDVRRGNITPQEQLLILELHSRWGNRWSKIAQYLPGRTDNEIKNYWRTRVQKHAKQLKCDVNSQQFKDTMRYLWMPRLIERIQAASSSSSPIHTASAATHSTTISNTCNHDLSRGDYSPLPLPQVPPAATAPIGMTPPPSYNNYSNISTSDNSSTSDSIIDNQLVLSSPASTGIDPYAACSTTDYHNNMDHQVAADYLIISPSSNYFNHGDQTMTTTDMDYYQWSNGDYYHTPNPNHHIDVSFWNHY